MQFQQQVREDETAIATQWITSHNPVIAFLDHSYRHPERRERSCHDEILRVIQDDMALCKWKWSYFRARGNTLVSQLTDTH